MQSATLRRQSGRILVLWGERNREIPPPPRKGEVLSEHDVAYWHGAEYAGLNGIKENLPLPPGDGARGKRVIYIQPGGNSPYMAEYRDNLKSKADRAGIELTVLESEWDDDLFDANVERAIGEKPDLILLNPENQSRSTEWYRRINGAGIPVVGGNFLPGEEGFRYILAWSGPDDWGQSRLLARSLADSLLRKGGYAILQHQEGTSSYYARTFGVITELKRYAPLMECLDTKPAGLSRERAYAIVKGWLEQHGERLKGIVCADDDQTALGMVDALEEAGRSDLICVACGTSRTGLELLDRGKLKALSYQSAAVDGSVAMENIVDWFEGVPVEPVRYLPKCIAKPEEAREFMEATQSVELIDLEILYRGIENLDWQRVYDFFGDIYEIFLQSLLVPLDVFHGFLLELLTGLILIIKRNGLDVNDTLGSYESLIKHLMRDDDIGRMLEWAGDCCQKVILEITLERDRKTPVQTIVEHIEGNYREPLSLKTLSYSYGLSQAYLGQLFRQETGEKFNDYLNRIRIEKACLLLLGDNAVASKIAAEVGYTDADYFYKVFKKVTGITVSAYIKENRS